MNQTYQTNLVPALSVGDLVSILWRRIWIFLIVIAVSIGAAYLITQRMKPLFKSSAQLALIVRNGTVTGSAEANLAASMVESPNTQLEFLNSSTMAIKTLQWIKNDALAKKVPITQYGVTDERQFIDKFASMVDVKVPKDTSVIIITATSEHPEYAAAIANAAAQTFVDWKREIAQNSVNETIKNLTSRLSRANSAMVIAETRERNFKRGQKMVDVPSEQKAALEGYLAAESDVRKLQASVKSSQEQVNDLRGRLKNTNRVIKSADMIRDDSYVQKLQSQLNDLQIQRNQLAQKYTEKYPGILPEIDAQIKDIRSRLDKAVKATVDTNRPSLQSQDAMTQELQRAEMALNLEQTRLASANSELSRSKVPLNKIPDTSMQYARLEREADLARNLHTSLLASLNATRSAGDLTSGNVQMTAWATPPDSPFSPNPQRNLLLGGVIGLCVSVFIVWAVENANSRIYNLQGVRQLVRGPVIGTLPAMSSRQMKLLEHGEPPAIATEMYSLARANLAMIARETLQADPWSRQVIMLTSAVPGEGKSVTAAHMSRSLARTGKTILLIDADMRKPSQNRLFNTSESTGLAEVLSGELSVEEAIVSSDTENLAILHAGTAHRNPTELVSLPKMIETIDHLRDLYDVILIDTPACAVVADALLLAPYVDSIVQVIGIGKVSDEMVLETTTALRNCSPKMLAYFVNHAPKENRHKYGKYYVHNTKYKNGSNGNGSTPAGEHRRIKPFSEESTARASEEEKHEA